MSFYDEEYTPANAEFPVPDVPVELKKGNDISREVSARKLMDKDFELELGESGVVAAPCREWELKDLRSKGGFEAKDGSPKGVINLRAKGVAVDPDTDKLAYPHTGEVAYWLEARRIDNPKDPQRRTAAMLGTMFQQLGLIPEGASPQNGAEVLAQLVQAASHPNVPNATFRAQLRWSKRAYQGRDGNQYHGREHEFAFIDSVKVAGNEDLPY